MIHTQSCRHAHSVTMKPWRQKTKYDKLQPMDMKLNLTLLPLWACLATATLAAETQSPTANATNHFNITGMHCDGCAGGLSAELRESEGVVSAQVTFPNSLAVVAFDTNLTSTARLMTVVKKAGFTATPAKP